MGYTPPEEEEKQQSNLPKKRKLIVPQVGDLVRYYDLDGGTAKGECLVGKITYLSKMNNGKWTAELVQLDNLGDGYYAEFSSRQRRKRTDRLLQEVSPLVGSWVRAEQAFSIPMTKDGQLPSPRQEDYDIDYETWSCLLYTSPSPRD